MKGVLPTGSFVTCSSDDTIRVWNLDPNMGTNTIYRRNIYSNVSLYCFVVRSRSRPRFLGQNTRDAYLILSPLYSTPVVTSMKYNTGLAILNLLPLCLTHAAL